ncbi:biotin/lipoyl attachment domain-containing protein [[Leptolyngbya] sp. PCC 7376]|uniref:HlyD family secretion protein n=1 Tax=[Leptolyngbya] sp. PCC 7376 TaxID=111781 RepID=UPI00029ED387|nr:HlyD family efflux transporter periplasmic adaptor subunit [[Leptolyngbya] sp. PCC 7376]AFY37601.1 biotin/lipoyl attachment domain-containing protein [[Leptolyngbya] sp. PCC 7376]
MVSLDLSMVHSNEEAVLPTISEQEFLPPISPWLSLGGLALATTMVSAFILAAVTKYKVTVEASTTIRPEGEIQIVESTEEGTVKTIKVKENQFVQAGETIALLDDSQLQLEQIQLQGSLEKLAQQQRQINQQMIALDRQLIAETERYNRIILSLEAQLAGQKREYQDRQSTTEKDLEETQADIKREEAELKISFAHLDAAKAELEAEQEKFKRYAPLTETGAISQELLKEIQLGVEQKKQNVLVQIQEIETGKQTLQIAQGRWEKAKIALNPSDSEVKITQQAIAREKAAFMAIQADLKREKNLLLGQSIELQKQGDREEIALKQVEKQIQRGVITAPTSGTVLKLLLRNSSQRVQPGTEIAQISPQNAPLTINALISAADIHNLEIGQTAQIRISACPYPDYGTLSGVLKEISTDTFISNNQSFYKAIITPQSNTFGDIYSSCTLQAGMEGNVSIVTKEETFLAFLLRKARLATDF